MLNVLYIFGEVLLILAMLGLIGVLIWFVMTVLHVKNTTLGHAKRLSQRPVAAVKNLITTAKGLAQQETVRVKHIGASSQSRCRRGSGCGRRNQRNRPNCAS